MRGAGTGFNNDVVRTVICANVAVDTVDVVSCVYCLVWGGLGVEALGMVGGGAVVFLGLVVCVVLRIKSGR